MSIKKRFSGIVASSVVLGISLASVGFAQPETPACADYSYTLETPMGLIGAENLEYGDDVAIFSDGACLESSTTQIIASEIRYSELKKELSATDALVISPEVKMWVGSLLIKGNILTGENIKTTTCDCGDNFNVESQSISLDTTTGKLIAKDNSVNLYGIRATTYPIITLETKDQEALANSLAKVEVLPAVIVSQSDTLGQTFGFKNYKLGQFTQDETTYANTLSIWGEGLGSGKPSGIIGLNSFGGTRRISLLGQGTARGLGASLSVTEDMFKYFVKHWTDYPNNRTINQFQAGLIGTLDESDFYLTPFAFVAVENFSTFTNDLPTVADIYAGARLEYRLNQKIDNFTFGFRPYAKGIEFLNHDPSLVVGATTSIGYKDGDFSASVSHSRAINLTPLAVITLEQISDSDIFTGNLSWQGLTLKDSHNLLTTRSVSGKTIVVPRNIFKATYTGETEIGTFQLENNLVYQGELDQEELQVRYIPTMPDCNGGFALSPMVGYDFKNSGISRYGLDLYIADCCFVWMVGFQTNSVNGVLQATDSSSVLPVFNTPSSTTLRFGLQLR